VNSPQRPVRSTREGIGRAQILMTLVGACNVRTLGQGYVARC